jgi:hypothetical protein
MTEQEFLSQKDAETARKYRHMVPGSLKRGTGTHEGKLVVTIKCTKCSKERKPVATSDLWQVSLCEACKKLAKTVKRKKAKGKVAAKATNNGRRPTLKEAVAVVKKLQGKGKQKVDLGTVTVVEYPTKVHHKTKAAVIKSFKEWSGGSAPVECDDAQITSFIDSAIDAKHNTPAITDWLRSLNKVTV